MKRILIATFFVFSLALLVPLGADAQSQCPSNATPAMQLNDPACWKEVVTSSYHCYWRHSFTEIGCSCPHMEDYRRKLHETCAPGCVDGTTFENYIDGCGATHCTNGPAYPKTWGQEWWVENKTQTCYYISSVNSWSDCVGSQQFATAVTWSTRSGTTCSNVPTQRYCCNPPTATMTVNGGPSPASVAFSDTFTIGMDFSTPDTGNGYSCTFTPPSQSNFTSQTASNINSVSWSPSGRITDIGPGPTATPRTFAFECTHPSAGCQNISRTVSVAANPEPLSVTISSNPPTPIEVVDSVRFFATPSGGVPNDSGQYTYTWSGAVSGGGTNTNNPTLGNYIDRHFGSLGPQTVSVTVRDSWNQQASDTLDVTIQDSRTPQ